jgi:hypothetical protein
LGAVIALGVFLASNAKPLPVPDIVPQLRAGASNLPVVKWQDTEVTITKQEAEAVTVADPAPEEPKEVEPVIEEAPAAGPEESTQEDQPDYGELDLLYRTVQAEGYTMGVEGMRLITDAILNLSRDRGCSVYETLTSGAYTVVNTGQIWRQSIYEETIAAVNAELGGQIDYDIKYFRTNHFHNFGTPCFAYGSVYFSS